MADFFKYIIYCFSLIPTWLTAVFIALLVFVITYLCMLYFTNDDETDGMQKDKAYDKAAEFDDLLATVLASKEKGSSISMKQPERRLKKSVSPAVVAAISAVVSKNCPSGTICSIETA